MNVGLGLIRDLAGSSSACTSAAAAASAAVLLRSAARCDFSESLDSQDGAWTLGSAQEGAGSTAGPGFTAELDGQNHTMPKHYQLRTISSVYTPWNLAFTAFRSILFNLLPLWHDYFQQVEAAEEKAFAQGLEPLEEWPPFPVEQVEPALHRSLWMSLRDLATLTVRRTYENLAARHCRLTTTTKLIKDAKASANRKAYLPFHQRLYRIPQTYFRATILGAAADCTVSIAVDTYRVIYVPAREGKVRRSRKRVLERFLRICAADALRCSTCLVVASVGAGVGAWLFTAVRRPGLGAFAGASAAEFGFTLFVVAPLVNDWAYGPDDGQPPRLPAPASKAPAQPDRIESPPSGNSYDSDFPRIAAEHADDAAKQLPDGD